MKTIKLQKADVENLFENVEHQSDIVVQLHIMCYGQEVWNRIKSLQDFCHCSKETNLYLTRLCQEFDLKHHKSFPGGAWLNYGFASDSADEKLGFLEIRPADFTVLAPVPEQVS